MITDEFKSSWDFTKSTSTYHFDSKRLDRFEDVIAHLGHIEPTWLADVADIVANSVPANWETRGYKGEGIPPPREDLIAEEYDLERVGVDPKITITHLNWLIPASLKKISDQFALDDCMERIHVQQPGEVWNLHIDKLQKWNPEDPARVMRIFVQLTDWQPGQFWEYGNHHWNQWRAGDVSTFDWANMPHSTANAGHHPRVTLQLTGVITDRTQEFLANIPR
jgi:hypothetical protein